MGNDLKKIAKPFCTNNKIGGLDADADKNKIRVFFNTEDIHLKYRARVEILSNFYDLPELTMENLTKALLNKFNSEKAVTANAELYLNEMLNKVILSDSVRDFKFRIALATVLEEIANEYTAMFNVLGIFYVPNTVYTLSQYIQKVGDLDHYRILIYGNPIEIDSEDSTPPPTDEKTWTASEVADLFSRIPGVTVTKVSTF